jgi:acyl-[acyl carrier protein]--UDP-N-acetylglucosamine O-acyltransferase
VVAAIRKAYRIAFQSKLKTEDALGRIRRELPALAEIEKFVSFIADSQRGICR